MELFSVMLFFAVAFVGLTSLIVDSKVMAPVREFIERKKVPFIFGHKLIDALNCHQCTGFWVGLTMWPLTLPFLPIEWSLWKLLVLIPTGVLVGCAISILAPLTRALQDYLTLNVSIPENLWNEQKPTDPLGN